MADAPGQLPLVLTAMAFRSILNDCEMAGLCQRHHGVHITGISIQMDRNDRLCFLCNFSLCIFGVNIPRIPQTVYKYWRCPAIVNRICRGYIGKRRH